MTEYPLTDHPCPGADRVVGKNNENRIEANP